MSDIDHAEESDDVVLLRAAGAIELRAQQLAIAYRALTETIQKYRKAAWVQGGESGASDVNNVAGQERIEEEVLGVLVAAGLGSVIERARSVNLHPVTDISARWERRLQSGKLTTTRRRRDPTAPWQPLPGQKLVGQERRG